MQLCKAAAAASVDGTTVKRDNFRNTFTHFKACQDKS
jgi:hypothetical protein